MEIKAIEAALEAVLFASGDPVREEKLAEALQVDKPTLSKVLGQLVARYDADEHGIGIVRLDGSAQMVTKAGQATPVKRALEITRDTPLSSAAMEVLSIIAYNQPVTRSFIEQVRGIDSSGVVGSLVNKGLIEECGRLELPGRPLAYRTTDNFLRCFGLQSLSQLPPLPKNQPEQQDSFREEEGPGGE